MEILSFKNWLINLYFWNDLFFWLFLFFVVVFFYRSGPLTLAETVLLETKLLDSTLASSNTSRYLPEKPFYPQFFSVRTWPLCLLDRLALEDAPSALSWLWETLVEKRQRRLWTKCLTHASRTMHRLGGFHTAGRMLSFPTEIIRTETNTTTIFSPFYHTFFFFCLLQHYPLPNCN